MHVRNTNKKWVYVKMQAFQKKSLNFQKLFLVNREKRCVQVVKKTKEMCFKQTSIQ